MLAGAVQSMGEAALAERRFYSLYAWCLNPILSVRDLLDRLGEELGRMELWDVPWQREESMINVYLLACAVACSIDDAQARAPRTLSAGSARFPAWRSTVRSFPGGEGQGGRRGPPPPRAGAFDQAREPDVPGRATRVGSIGRSALRVSRGRRRPRRHRLDRGARRLRAAPLGSAAREPA